MPNPDTESTAQHEVIVPADLSPADADKIRTEAIEKVAAAKDAGQPLNVALDADRGGPCAVQIVVAAQRSADAAGVALTIPEGTLGVLSEMGIEMKGVS